MKKGRHDRSRKEVSRIIEKWRGRLFLRGWFVDTRFVDEDKPIEGCPGSSVYAEVHVDHVYLRAHITVFPCWRAAPKDVREHVIVHELCHCLTQQAWDAISKLRDGVLVTAQEAREIIEKLTQRISYVAMQDEWRK